jgi:hypothetical protein
VPFPFLEKSILYKKERIKPILIRTIKGAQNNSGASNKVKIQIKDGFIRDN